MAVCFVCSGVFALLKIRCYITPLGHYTFPVIKKKNSILSVLVFTARLHHLTVLLLFARIKFPQTIYKPSFAVGVNVIYVEKSPIL